MLHSPEILKAADFQAIVMDGKRAPNGMASFKRFFGPKEAEDIRAYLLKEAALSGGATGTVAAKPAGGKS